MSNPNIRVDKSEDLQPIAIIGIGCRFPGAESVQQYWQLLINGVDAVSEVPADRWNAEEFYDPDLATPGKMNTRWGGFLKQVEQFDPLFFGISPREAAQMDPQQRLMLEISWEALANAGQDIDSLRESATGVFFGASWSDYATLHHKDGTDYIAQHTATGTHFSIIANRVSYIFGWRGPSMVIDTACSSSLVAVHQACQSLRSGESTLALAGGVHLMLAPDSTLMMSKFGGLSPDGRCRTFDAQSNGFVRAEGGGVVLLKPLVQALADGDPIYALIRGSAVNNDGRDTGMTTVQRLLTAAREIRNQRRQQKSINPGLTVPSTAAQESVLRAACYQAGVAPADMQYVEAHGTGTPLGDPIEAKALSAVYCTQRDEKRPLRIGSVKTNIGHMEAAAGIGGLIKVALSLKHGLIPPSLHFKQPNPNISFDTLKLRVQTTATPWPQADKGLAGVSSFGFGGTNCHVVLAAAPSAAAPAAKPEQRYPLLLPLSARSPEARQQVAQNILSLLHEQPELSLYDLGYTASLRSSHHPYRLAAAFANRDELIAALTAFCRGETAANIVAEQTPSSPPAKPVFVFSGQGPQWWGMGRELFVHEPVYRAVIESCDQLLREYADWSLVDELLAPPESSRLQETAVAQPALFALQIALAALWQSWGIEPGAVVGHSVGEVAAAYVAGSLTLAQAISVIYHRGRLMQAAAGLGKMAAVGLSPAAAAKLINGTADRLAIAAINGPDAITLSGDADALEQLIATLAEADIFYRRLPVDFAFHSPQMAPFQQQLVQALGDLQGQTAVVPFVSTVTGEFVEGSELDAVYWGRNIRETVRFDTAVATLIQAGRSLFIEIGPHPVLANYISNRLTVEQTSGHVLPSLRRQQPECMTMLASLGALYTLGYLISWQAHYPMRGQLVTLPAYPWQRERYWLPTQGHLKTTASAGANSNAHPLLGTAQRSPLLKGGMAFDAQCSLSTHPFLKDHRLYGAVVVPGAHHISLVLSAVQAHLGTDACQLRDITFTQALTLPEAAGRQVQVVLMPTGDAFNFEIYSADGEHNEWQLHASGQVATAMVTAVANPPDVQTIRSRCQEPLNGDTFYEQFHEAGYHLGPRFQWLAQMWRRDGEAVGRLRLPQQADQMGLFQLPPGLIDSLFQFLCVTLSDGGIPTILHTGDIYIPLGIDAFHFYGRSDGHLWCHACLHPRQENTETFVGDVHLFDEAGQTVVMVKGLHFKRAPQSVLLRPTAKESDSPLYEVTWQQRPFKLSNDVPVVTQWIIFSNGDSVSEALISHLQAEGQRTLIVQPGDAVVQQENGRWQLNPAEPDQFVRLLGHAENNAQIVYLWGGGSEPLSQAQTHASQGLLHLVQALARLSLSHSPQLWIVTQRATAVTAVDTSINISQAPLWGLGRVIALEHAELWGGLVDVEPDAFDAALVLAHLRAATGGDQMAFRYGQRYLARLAHSQPKSTDACLPVHSRGTYLITGGLGALGLVFARQLVQQGARHLLLLGRRPPSPAAAAVIQELTAAEVHVEVMLADVADEAQVMAVLAHMSSTMPPLRGVIHAAGVLQDGILLNQDWSQFERVLAPKVTGGWNLHLHTQNQPLDFFVLFSSIAALLGSAGQGNYAAANAFLDGLAQVRRQQGLPALSINWGPWAVGMAETLNETQKQRWLAQGIQMIVPEQGVALLAEAQQIGAAQIGAFSVDWHTFSRQSSLRHDWLFLADLGTVKPPPAQAETAVESQFVLQLHQAPATKKKELLRQHVQQQVAQVLGLSNSSRFDPQKRLFEMGLDSLMAVDLQKRLQTSLDKRLSKTVVFDYPTVNFLTDYLAQELLDEETAVVATASVPANMQPEIEALSEAEAEALLLAELEE